MAEYLASIFGTEKDKVNCSFFFKIGACRHGERCSRLHNKPTFSQTILMQNLYLNPQNIAQTADKSQMHSKMKESPVVGARTTVEPANGFPFTADVFRLYDQLSNLLTMTDEDVQTHYDEFFEEIFLELEDKYGKIEEMNVCDNLGDHLVGNVYVKFESEENAERAVRELNDRWFNGRPVNAELSPVTDFREACCRQYEMGECTRGGFCNFMHLKPISRELRRELYGKNKKKSRSRSPQQPARRSRSRSRDRQQNHRSRGDKRRSRSRDRVGRF